MDHTLFNLDNLTETQTKSISSKYDLTIQKYRTGERTWEYSVGIVTNKEHQVITPVKRNYSEFPYALVENHPLDKNDYFICGENYQGQTIVNLTTKEKISYLPPDACKGGGLCWVNIEPSPNKLVLAVEACYWGGSYDLYLFDFSTPMRMPYKELACITEVLDGQYYWVDDNTIKVTQQLEVRKSDGKLYDELSDEEQDYLTENNLTEFIIKKKYISI